MTSLARADRGDGRARVDGYLEGPVPRTKETVCRQDLVVAATREERPGVAARG